MTDDMLVGFGFLTLVFLLGVTVGSAWQAGGYDAKAVKRDKKILSTTHPDTIVRDPKLTPVLDFMKQTQTRFETLMSAAQLTCIRGWALWWVMEAQRDMLDRRVVSIQHVRDLLAGKCKAGDMLHYAEVDKLLGYMQTTTEETQEALARAQQNLEGNPESRIPQKTGWGADRPVRG